jgi:sulfur carrier protein ThiS
MMKIRVKWFGTLKPELPDCDPEKGLEVEIAAGATVKDLLGCLNISESKGAAVAVGGKVLRPEDPLTEGALVCLLQAVYGG